MKKTLVGILVIVLFVLGGVWIWNYKQRLRQDPPIASNESGIVTPQLSQNFHFVAPEATSTIEPPDILRGGPQPLVGVQWVPAQNGDRPSNAVSAGDELVAYLQGTPRTLYVCRAAQGNGIHPGKLVGGGCNIAYGGKEIEVRQYEVAVYSGGSWGNRGLQGALVGGFENNQRLYVCRHRLKQSQLLCFMYNCVGDLGWHAGKFLPNTGECFWGYGGGEMSDNADNELFYP